MKNPFRACPILLVAFALALAGCSSTRTQSPAQAAGLTNLGHHSFKITTKSPEAQRAFDRGLTWAYSFGHYAAEQEFRAALAADPDCAMAWWGIALVNGPHINFPLVPPEKAAKAWEAITAAQRLSAHCTPLEQSLIAALSQRYANPQPEDRSPLDQAYADAMRALWRANPANADVATLFAESVMDLHPWNYWHNGVAQPWTPEIISTLEAALRIDANHPGANHYYIHAMEASSRPGRARAAADRLPRLVPDSSHMVHMPAHIYIRVGEWEKAAAANRNAIAADARYRAAYPRPGFYGLYMAHNAHFLAFVDMMQGQSADALALADRVVTGIPEDFLRDYPAIADGFMVFRSEVEMRFGRWDAVLQEPEPAPQFLLARALWRYSRAVALTALGRMDDARAERALFQDAVAAVPAERTKGNNAAADILAIAALSLDGEMLAKEEKFDEAILKLREAVQREDKLVYNEPPDWIQPVRHTLGAVLLRAGRAAEAEKVYREDLRAYPENGWSLMGLRDALTAQGKKAEAEAADARFRQQWAKADISPPSTCYCQTLKR
jgi:tetratricopeptide (TPR) repeat protein